MTKKEIENLTDQQLITHLIAKNNLVVKYFFHEKCKPMFGYIMKEVFGRKVDENELISELYLFLSENDFEKMKKFEGRSKLTTWLSVVAVRFFIKKKSLMIDSRDNKTLHDQEVIDLNDRVPYERFIEKYDLYKAIDKLENPRDKFVIMAIDIEGRDDKEIAEELGVTVANLYNIRGRARKLLSNILKGYKYVD